MNICYDMMRMVSLPDSNAEDMMGCKYTERDREVLIGKCDQVGRSPGRWYRYHIQVTWKVVSGHLEGVSFLFISTASNISNNSSI